VEKYPDKTFIVRIADSNFDTGLLYLKLTKGPSPIVVDCVTSEYVFMSQL